MKPALANCLVAFGSITVAILWVVLLLSSLFFAPKRRMPIVRPWSKAAQPATAVPPASMRLLERMLIVTSVLLMFAVVAFYLGVRAMPD